MSGLVDLSKVAAMVCMDMMGGNFFPRDTRSLYALGAENSPEIQGAMRKISVDGLDVRPMGINLIEPLGEIYARSDYGSFRLKKVPFVFFSTGQPWTVSQARGRRRATELREDGEGRPLRAAGRRRAGVPGGAPRRTSSSRASPSTTSGRCRTPSGASSTIPRTWTFPTRRRPR
jgi:hypothetical protein